MDPYYHRDLCGCQIAEGKWWPCKDHMNISLEEWMKIAPHAVGGGASGGDRIAELEGALRDVLGWVGTLSHDSSKAWTAYERARAALSRDDPPQEGTP